MNGEHEPLRFYLLEVATIQPLKEGEEAELLRHVWNQDEQQESASKRLIEANLHLVVSIAKGHSSAGLPMLDLIENGNIGLMVALETFATDGPGSFSDHAAGCIERAISKASLHDKR